jgi:hypothetical protein
LENLAIVASAQGQEERAARLFGAAEIQREAINETLTPADQAEYNSYVAAVRAQLDEPTFAAAWAAGRALPFEQAVAEGLADTTG